MKPELPLPISLVQFNIVITCLLTYSMEQSPSGEVNRFPASQEIPRVLWNPNFHYPIRKYNLIYLLLAYLLTYSMEQSPPGEDNRFPASQEIPRILWNPKVPYPVHKYNLIYSDH